MIRVQQEDFDIGAETDKLIAGNSTIGGLVTFVGLVRDFVGKVRGAGEPIAAMTLEHYPGMTERKLAEIEAEANRRWPLAASLIIHRYGKLMPGDRIVMVACAAAHREDAFAACQFLIDWLKTQAPFWKLEDTASGPRWVSADARDDALAARWVKTEYSGMTVNERLFEAGLLEEWDDAARKRNRAKMIALLQRTDLPLEDASATTDAVLANPAFYGF